MQERPNKKYGEIGLDPQIQNIEVWLEDRNANIEVKEDDVKERKIKAVMQNQAKAVQVEDVLCQILDRLDKIEEMQLGIRSGLADRS
jgi:hypothetical protein